MKRFVKTVRIAPTIERVTVRLVGDSNLNLGQEMRRVLQIQHLQQLADTPDLQICGEKPFETARTWWDGDRWVTELIAVREGLTPEVQQGRG